MSHLLVNFWLAEACCYWLGGSHNIIIACMPLMVTL